MKNFFEKSIIVCMLVVLCSVNAAAQKVVTSINTSDFSACKEYLTKNPNDTVVNETDTTMVKVFLNVSDNRLKRQVYKKTHVVVEKPLQEVVDFEKVSAYDKKAVDSRFNYHLTEGRRKDVVYYESSNSINETKAVKKAADKDGFSVIAEGSYQLVDGANGISGNAGIAYTGTFWQLYVTGGAARTYYSANAELAGKNYWAFKAESGLLLQPFKLDRYDQNRLFIGGGIGYEYYETGSVENPEIGNLKSWGNYLYPHVDLKFSHRFFATGNEVYMKASWRQKKFILQNSDTENKSALELAVGFAFGVGRNRINNQ